MHTILIITSKLVCLCLCYLPSSKAFLSFSKFTLICLHTSLQLFILSYVWSVHGHFAQSSLQSSNPWVTGSHPWVSSALFCTKKSCPLNILGTCQLLAVLSSLASYDLMRYSKKSMPVLIWKPLIQTQLPPTLHPCHSSWLWLGWDQGPSK